MKTTEKQRTEKTTRPPSRWRNRWLVLKGYTSFTGHEYSPGEQWGYLEWPSRDTAETYGQQCEAGWPHLLKHLGAFPVDAA